jgi:hypothetical protein
VCAPTILQSVKVHARTRVRLAMFTPPNIDIKNNTKRVNTKYCVGCARVGCAVAGGLVRRGGHVAAASYGKP